MYANQTLQNYGRTPEEAAIALANDLRAAHIKRYEMKFKKCPYTATWTAYVQRSVLVAVEAE